MGARVCCVLLAGADAAPAGAYDLAEVIRDSAGRKKRKRGSHANRDYRRSVGGAFPDALEVFTIGRFNNWFPGASPVIAVREGLGLFVRSQGERRGRFSCATGPWPA